MTPFATGGLVPALNELERLLDEAEPLSDLSSLADPLHLELLFHVRLATLVRRGPAAGTDLPHRLLSVAQEAAAAGALPLSAAADLRRTLGDLESRLKDAGAWDPARPLWWSPLPDPTPLADLWVAFRRDDVGAALAAPRPWLCLPAFLEPALTRAIWRALEDAEGLELERGGVGASGERTARRSDLVRYFSGLEPELLAAVPHLAALIQWGLSRFARRLAAGGRGVHPPRTAMLARYPAPSAGYAPHLDNPGGEHDNGRALTLVIYLNAPGEECAGGEIALWGEGESTEDAPARLLPPLAGSAVLFDSRTVAHQVRPVGEGPARWALTFWLNDAPQQPEPLLPRPRIALTDALLPVASPPLPPATLLFHELADERPSGEIVVRRSPPAKRPRCGIVCTAYREGERLDAWCEHHLALGVDHLVLIFDHAEEPREAAAAERLRARYPADRLTLWPGGRTAERWSDLPRDRTTEELVRFAALGASSYAVASRQTLNASVALAAARTGELGGALLDWLLHLDADELFYLEGAARGGATPAEHFAAAGAAGLELLRYANHELLLPHEPGTTPRFKVNPRLAAARLGPSGWKKLVAHLEMAQTDRRPYFTGYVNGKSAVAVAAAGAAAGVHGWSLREGAGTAASRFLAGPSVLHFHFATAAAFAAKYLAIAASPAPAEAPLFELSPAEEATVELIRGLERDGCGAARLGRRLAEHHRELTGFAPEDVELLDEAGLVLRPNVAFP